MTSDGTNSERRILTVLRWPVGGIRTYIHYVYPALHRAGYRFTFAGPANASFRAFRAELDDWSGNEFVEVRCEAGIDVFRPDLRRLLKSGRYRLIHSQGITSAIQVAMANWGIGLPHAATSHDVFRADQFAGWRGRLKRAAMTRLLRRVNLIVNVSDDAQRNLVEYLPGLGDSHARLITIFNGIDIKRFDRARCPHTGWLRRQLGLSDQTRLMGFLGRFVEQKGFLPLLVALENLRDQNWHLAAFGGGDMVREYKAECQRRGMGSRVTFMEFTAEVERVLPEIDLLVMPSLWEACPLLPMEAMALGTPVVGSDCVGLREVLADTPAARPPAGDSQQLARALREALEQPRWAEAVAYSDSARARFDGRRCAERLREELDRLCELQDVERPSAPWSPPHGGDGGHEPSGVSPRPLDAVGMT